MDRDLRCFEIGVSEKSVFRLVIVTFFCGGGIFDLTIHFVGGLNFLGILFDNCDGIRYNTTIMKRNGSNHSVCCWWPAI